MNDVLCNTKYLQLKVAKSKSGSDWVYAHRPNARDVVVILPFTGNQILFLIEERPPLIAENKCKYNIGLPAGLVGDERLGESVLDAIKAELLEEAGLVADNIKIVGKNISSSSGCVSETVTIAIAYITNTQIIKTPVSDDGVIIDRIWVDLKNTYNWLTEMSKKGYSISGQTLAALYFLQEENKTCLQKA